MECDVIPWNVKLFHGTFNVIPWNVMLFNGTKCYSIERTAWYSTKRSLLLKLKLDIFQEFKIKYYKYIYLDTVSMAVLADLLSYGERAIQCNGYQIGIICYSVIITIIIVCALYCKHQIVYGFSLSQFLWLPEASVSGCGDKPWPASSCTGCLQNTL